MATALAIGVMVGVGVAQPTTVKEWEAKKVANTVEEDRELEAKWADTRFERECMNTPHRQGCSMATLTGFHNAYTAQVHEVAVGVGVVIVIGVGVFGLIWLIRLPQRREIALLQKRLREWRDAKEKEEGCRKRAERQLEELRKADDEQIEGMRMVVLAAGKVVVAIIAELYAGRGTTRQELGRVAHACRLRLRDEVLPTLIPNADERDAALERARRERDPDEKAEPVSAIPSPSAA